jgi:hypothetical protein
MMVGRTIFESAPEVPEHPSDEIVLEARNLNRGAAIQGCQLQARRARSWALPG